uniref:Uncharacterized protein n=1 Tax=Oryza brachyantha TaxID=4533 RepID=J3MCU9_ORYBR
MERGSVVEKESAVHLNLKKEVLLRKLGTPSIKAAPYRYIFDSVRVRLVRVS